MKELVVSDYFLKLVNIVYQGTGLLQRMTRRWIALDYLLPIMLCSTKAPRARTAVQHRSRAAGLQTHSCSTPWPPAR